MRDTSALSDWLTLIDNLPAPTTIRSVLRYIARSCMTAERGEVSRDQLERRAGAKRSTVFQARAYGEDIGLLEVERRIGEPGTPNLPNRYRLHSPETPVESYAEWRRRRTKPLVTPLVTSRVCNHEDNVQVRGLAPPPETPAPSTPSDAARRLAFKASEGVDRYLIDAHAGSDAGGEDQGERRSVVASDTGQGSGCDSEQESRADDPPLGTGAGPEGWPILTEIRALRAEVEALKDERAQERVNAIYARQCEHCTCRPATGRGRVPGRPASTPIPLCERCAALSRGMEGAHAAPTLPPIAGAVEPLYTIH